MAPSVHASLALALTLACHVFSISLASDCPALTSCLQCQTSSATCGWCHRPGSQTSRCVALAAKPDPPGVCEPCGARQAAPPCDDSTCVGVNDEVCSGHGTCQCGVCTCEPRHRGALCQNCPTCWGYLCTSVADCARCFKREANATLCASCPVDTQLTVEDPVEPDASKCRFDSVSIADDSLCSFKVFHWRDDLLVRHARVWHQCRTAADRSPFAGLGQITAAPATATASGTSSHQQSAAATSGVLAGELVTVASSRPPSATGAPKASAGATGPPWNGWLTCVFCLCAGKGLF